MIEVVGAIPAEFEPTLRSFAGYYCMACIAELFFTGMFSKHYLAHR